MQFSPGFSKCNTYQVMRLSILGEKINSLDSPPTVEGWVSYRDLEL